MPSIRLHSYLVRLIWICIAPLLILLAVFALRTLQDVWDDEAREANALARNVAASVDRQVQSRISGLQMLATSPLIRDRARWADLYESAQGYRQAFGSHVILAESAGQMLFNTRSAYGAPLPRLPIVKGHGAAPTALATGQPAVGDQFLGPVAGEPLVAIVVPVSIAGKVPYLLLTTVEASYFVKRLEEFSLPRGWTLTLQDGKQEAIAHRIPPGGFFPAHLSQTYSASLTKAPWSVIVGTPSPWRTAAVTEAALALTLLILGAVLVGIYGGRFASRRLTHSLDALASGVEHPALPATVSDIEEVEAIRRRLAEAGDARHESERELLRSERRLSMAQEAAKAGAWEWEVATNTNYWSDAVFRLYGYAPGECSPSFDNWLAAINPDDRAGISSAVETAKLLAKPIAIEWRTNRPGSEEHWLMARGEPQFDAAGRLSHYVGIVMDITDRKRAELARTESEKRFQDIVEASADWVWEVDAEARYTYVSDSVEKLLGYRPEEILGRTPFDLMLPEEAARVAGEFAAIVARRAPFRDLDNINVHKNGSLCHVQTNGMPILDRQGNLAGYRGLDRDVTRQKQAERFLRDSEERLRTLVQTMPDLVWLKDTNGVYLACNRRFEQFFGAAEAQIVGRTDYDFVDRELADFFRARDRAAIEAGGPMVNEEEVSFSSDGHREMLQTIKTPMFDESGAVIGVLGVARDITQIRANEQELERHRTHLEELVKQRTEDLAAAHEKLKRDAEHIADLYDRAPIGYHSLDPEGTIIAVNETELKMLGYAREEFVGRKIAEFLTPESRALFASRFEEFRRTGRIRNLEYEVTCRDGRILPVLISADIVRDKDGAFLFNRATMADDSERKLHEREIAQLQSELARRADAAEAANAAKSAFLANMSHEIRTPMNAIIGLTHLLRADAPTASQAERLNKIDWAAKHLLSVINDILDLSKIEAGKVVLEERNFSLEQVLDHVR